MNQSDIDVVIINDYDYIQGGASKVAIQTANMLVGSVNRVFFFSGATSNNIELNESVIRICTNQGEALNDKNKIRGVINGLYNFKAKRELKKLLNNLNPNKTIVHIHGWTKCLSPSIFSTLFKSKFKVVLSLHDYFTACPNGGYYNYQKNAICHLKPLSCKCAFTNCDSRNYFFKIYRVIRQFIQNKVVKLNNRIKYVITLSDFSQKILNKTLNNNIVSYRINNPVDYDCNFNEKDVLDFDKNDYYLCVGRIDKEKNVELFCKTITSLDLNGIVVGDGKQKKELETRFPNIKFVGWKSSNEVKEYMKKCRAMIFTSNLYEVAPLTPNEVMQYGIPCLAPKTSAAADYNKNYNLLNYDNTFDGLKTAVINYEKNITYYKNKIKLSKSDYAKDIICCYKSIMEGKNE